MEISNYPEEEMLVQDVWKFVVEVHGALSVMTTGITLMLKLYVINWDLHQQVCQSGYS